MKINFLKRFAKATGALSVLFTFLLPMVLTSCVSYKPISKTDFQENKTISGFINPGNVIQIKLKTGEVIKKLKVQEIGSEKISGTQWVKKESKGTEFLHVNKTIDSADIQSLKKRKFSPLKTFGLVVGVVGLPVLIFAVTYHPPSSYPININFN